AEPVQHQERRTLLAGFESIRDAHGAGETQAGGGNRNVLFAHVMHFVLLESLRAALPSRLRTRAPTLFRIHLVETKLAPARLRSLDIVRRGPDGRRVACAAEFGIGVVVEVDGRVDQHPVPLPGPIERRVAVAFAGRWIETQAKGRWHDDNVV